MSAPGLRGERERRRKREYREAILHAAEAVIMRKGYSAATMDDVAREAQFSKATVYKYFPSKSELVFEILVHYFDEAGERLEAIRNEKRSARERLRRSILAALEFYEEKRNISRVLMMDQGMLKFLRIFVAGHSKTASPADRKAMRVLLEKREEVQAGATKIIEEGIASREFRRVDPAAVVAFIDAVVHGYAHGQFMTDETPDVARTADMIFEFVLNGINRPGKSGKET